MADDREEAARVLEEWIANPDNGLSVGVAETAIAALRFPQPPLPEEMDERTNTMDFVIRTNDPAVVLSELAKWARKNAASRLNDSKRNSRTAPARRMLTEAGTYNDVADFLERVKIEPIVVSAGGD